MCVCHFKKIDIIDKRICFSKSRKRLKNIFYWKIVAILQIYRFQNIHLERKRDSEARVSEVRKMSKMTK